MNLFNKKLVGKLVLLGLVLLTGVRCGGSGVEVGSPDLPPVTSTNSKNKALIITPEDQQNFPFSIQVIFLNDQFASVSKFATPGANSNLVKKLALNAQTTDSVVVEYSKADNTITVSGTFSDGSDFSITINVNDDEEFENISLAIDNQVLAIQAEGLASDQDANAEDSAQALENGRNQLANQSFAEAKATYCNAFNNNPENSELAFGCFFTKLVEMSGSDEYQSLMTAFDELQIPLIDRLLADGGLLDRKDEVHSVNNNFPAFNYIEFDLPFSQKINDYNQQDFKILSDKFERLAQVLIEQNITINELKTRINNFKPYFLEFEILLSIVVADEDFSFDMPGSAFRLDSNFNIIHNDILFTLSGVQATIVGFDVMMAYHQGIELEKIMTEDRFVAGLLQVNAEVLVADLNGSGELINVRNGQAVQVDEIAFLTLENAELIRSNRDRFLSALVLANFAMTNLLNGQISILTATPSSNYELESGNHLLDDLITSMITNEMTPLRVSIPSHLNVSTQNISANLQAFFTNPPSASNVDIAVGDPFVVGNRDQAQAVKAYFNAFFDGIINF